MTNEEVTRLIEIARKMVPENVQTITIGEHKIRGLCLSGSTYQFIRPFLEMTFNEEIHVGGVTLSMKSDKLFGTIIDVGDGIRTYRDKDGVERHYCNNNYKFVVVERSDTQSFYYLHHAIESFIAMRSCGVMDIDCKEFQKPKEDTE